MFAIMDKSFNIEELIVNGVRSRKKHTELPSCPVCSCTVRANELEAHFALEIDRLNKVSGNASRASGSSASSSRLESTAGPSTTNMEEAEVDTSGCTGGDVYQRVKHNRMRRLRARRRTSPVTGECPVCGVRMPQSRLPRHAVRCLRRSGAPTAGDYVPDTSSDEDGSIDVENDGSESGSGFGDEYRWCGQWRVRATALAAPEALDATPVRRASTDTQLVVDGDEDTELYGPPQYSPSRIDLEAEPPTATPPVDAPPTNMATNGETAAGDASDTRGAEDASAESEPPRKKHNGLLEASCMTRVQALTDRIRELEAQHQSGSENKCLICLSPYTSPVVSIQCWHVYCEVCWMESLRAKKLCPQCNAITVTRHLRRIYM